MEVHHILAVYFRMNWKDSYLFLSIGLKLDQLCLQTSNKLFIDAWKLMIKEEYHFNNWKKHHILEEYMDSLKNYPSKMVKM